MFRKAIRWELPISYAMIALLSVLALGASLVFTLNRYYSQRELDYLTGNAIAISVSARRMMSQIAPAAVMRAHMESYAFLSQVRVRLFDSDGRVLVDTGTPRRSSFLSISAQPQVPATDVPGDPTQARPTVQPMPNNFCNFDSRVNECPPTSTADLPNFPASYEIPIEIPISSSSAVEYYTPVMTLNFRRSDETGGYVSLLPASSTLFGFGLTGDSSDAEWRSNQVTMHAVTDEKARVIAYIELSQGPAYGREIIDSVARGWLAGAGLAMLFAAGVGVLISRRITEPLLSLTQATGDMAGGRLSVRAQVLRADEIGMLAHSFNHMAERVEGTIATLRRFVADAAHELHTPITALRTNIELAMAEVADSPYPGISYEYLQRAQIQLERLQSLTDSLLDLSRLEARLEQKDHQSFLLSDVVAEMGEIYASRAEQLGLNFEMTLPPQPVFLTGNATQLRAALGNLLSNAIKFTPEGGTVQLVLREDEHALTIQISDTGIGISEEDAPLLFERFYRAPNAAAYPGSGLGLTIVKSIIDAHGGTITAVPQQPGTLFTITFPL